ncbi:hypothetical protein LIPSTDRAFT_244829 [Lipomyces starkeyi NRRL Y-11557]|uniref:Uncharacterized protein n=1 Tax=Lipomyces starkeyi NRRL Y-11557 TaxID=675824 RepID=A0A1E3Q8U4_LIPST|nr:hypothetical protein LIPSTDRAFT_244829 [Lipomyces starkeyi NRRL Y-11557]
MTHLQTCYLVLKISKPYYSLGILILLVFYSMAPRSKRSISAETNARYRYEVGCNVIGDEMNVCSRKV